MLDFHEKRKLKSYLYSRYVVGALFIFAILLSISVFERYVAERKVAQKRDEIKNELEALQQRESVLEAEVSRLKSDRGLEEEIRDRYEVSRAGERIVVIVGDDEREETSSSTVPSKVVESHPFWAFWR
jgi:cell division protein FtsB